MVNCEYSSIEEVLDNSKKVVLIDGGLGTELEKRKVNIHSLLWCSIALVEEPEAITKLHYDYYHSGANLGITCTYQCCEDSLKLANKAKYSSREERLKVYRTSVEVCQKAQQKRLNDDINGTLLVKPGIAGSVGPYGSYLNDGSEFTGDYQRTEKEYRAFYEEKLEYFMNKAEAVEYLQLETMPNFAEIKALLKLVKEKNSVRKLKGEAEKKFVLSFSLRNDEQLADGTYIKDVMKYLAKEGYLVKEKNKTPLVAVGANCFKLKYSVKLVENLKNFMNELEVVDFPIIVYPNSGEIYDGIKKTWIFDESNEKYYHVNEKGEKVCNWKILLDSWISNGARIIGGCCRVGVSDIVEMNKVIAEYNAKC